MTKSENATLYTLGEHGKTIDGSANDIRRRHVKDRNGHGIGKITDLLVDDQEDKIRFLIVDHGGFLGFGASTSLIPVDAVTKITENDVAVDQSRERIAAAPGYDPELIHQREYHDSVYRHYGYTPYWAPGSLRAGGMPLFPAQR